jgi:hypothetical protein
VTFFLDHANEAEPRLDAMLFALASEFRPTSRHDAEGTLDHLAMRVTPGAVVPSRDDLLAIAADFEAAESGGPDDVLIDHVLVRRRGHPMLLAAVVNEAARRAGLATQILAGKAAWVVSELATEPTVFVDPARHASWPQPGTPPHLLRRLCPHQVSFAVLAQLGHRYASRGDPARAVKARELQLELPLCAELRSNVEYEHRRLQALFN